MQVNPIQVGSAGASAFGALGDAAGSAAAGLSSALNYVAPERDSLLDIASRYDLRNISPKEFSELITALHEAGQISDDELAELSAIRLALENDNLDPHERIDLIDLLEQKLGAVEGRVDDLQSDGNPDQSALNEALAVVKQLSQQLTWLHRFDSARTGSGDDRLDTVV